MRWQARQLRPRLSSIQNDWLREPASLTARCQRQWPNFRLRLLAFGPAPALADWPRRRWPKTLAREVLLEGNGEPLIFARTELPAPRRGRLLRWLHGLGERSLGSLLFSHPGFIRGPIVSRRLDARHPLYHRALATAGLPTQAPAELWARRCWHHFGSQRVLVCEVFLPAALRPRQTITSRD